MKIMNKVTALLMLVGASYGVSAATVGTGGVSTAFSKDSTRVSIAFGEGSAFDNNYLILGMGVGYYVAKGLEIGVEAEHWFLQTPSLSKIAPKVTYVFTQAKTIKPYVGAFYSRTFYGDYKGKSLGNQNSYGYRAGAFFSTKRNIYIGGGIVHEEYVNCNRLHNCSSTYPEMSFAVSF